MGLRLPPDRCKYISILKQQTKNFGSATWIESVQKESWPKRLGDDDPITRDAFEKDATEKKEAMKVRES